MEYLTAIQMEKISHQDVFKISTEDYTDGSKPDPLSYHDRY